MTRFFAIGVVICAATVSVAEAAPSRAKASINNASEEARGSATVRARGKQLRIDVAVTDFAPGTYGIHVHAIGKCVAPDYQSAGGHWNPTAHQHGRDNPAGAHAGDLPNLVVGADGTGKLRLDVPGKLRGEGGLLDADGAAIVIHAQPDDYRTDPSGNSGSRLACGVFG